MKCITSSHRVTWLLLGGAFVLSVPSCGGRANDNEGSGGGTTSGDTAAAEDRDDDGVLDSLGTTVDRDKDGEPDRIDVDGDGKEDGIAVDIDEDGKPDGVGLDTDGDGIIDAIDTDGDGRPDDTATTSGDGDDGSGGNSGDGDGDSSSGGTPASTGGQGTGGDVNQSNPGVQSLGKNCGDAGALACAGENQKLQLLCYGSKWVQNGTCSGSTVCDTGEANRGSCQEPVPGCADKDPGEPYCGAADEVHSCGPDRLGGMRLEECSGRCVDGECVPGDVCPNASSQLFDCSEECAELDESCSLNSTNNCGNVTILEGDTMPAVVRTASSANSCDDVPISECENSLFIIRFEDPDTTYRVELPDGVKAQSSIQPLQFDSWPNACEWEESSQSTCVTVEARSNLSSYDSTDVMIAVVTFADADGARNVVVKEGACPQ